MNLFYDLIIIGAGAAGLFAAAQIDNRDNKKSILILEKNSSAGNKLLLTGNGKCNITNALNINDFFEHYNSNSRKFLRKPFYNFDNNALINFFENYDIKFHADTDGRILPVNADAEKIRNILLKCCKENFIEIRYNQPVKYILKNNDEKYKFRIADETQEYLCAAALITTGGYSYQITGSTGDGYKFAEELGHSIIRTKPALSQIYIEQYQFADIAGSSVKNANIRIFRNKKKLFDLKCEILFTHRGLSGPEIINISRDILPGDEILMSFDCMKTEQTIKHLFHTNQNSQLKKALKHLNLTERIICAICDINGIDAEMQIFNLAQPEKNRIIQAFLNFQMNVECAGDFKTAMITSGGINLKEINPATMESRIVPNLFFAGEILDIDGDTGGYNLQAAFSTAKTAANNF